MYYIFNIARGIGLNLVFHILLVAILISTGFQLNLTGYSISLIIILSIIGFYVGIKSKRFGLLNGLIVGVAVCWMLLLYIAQREAMDQKANLYLFITYGGVSAISAFVGSMFNKSGKTNPKQNTKQNIRTSRRGK